jgi:hypothetical protein
LSLSFIVNLSVAKLCARPVNSGVSRRDSGIGTMQPSRIFETVLYAEDLAAAERFYHEALGLDVIGRGELAAGRGRPR